MKSAIISDVDKNEFAFTHGVKSLKKIVTIDDLGEVFYADDEAPQERVEQAAYKSPQEKALLRYITDFCGQSLDTRPNAVQIYGLVAGTMFLIKRSDIKYEHYIIEETPVKFWTGTYNVAKATKLGNYKIIRCQSDFESAHVIELKSTIVSLARDHNDALAQSYSYQSQANMLGAENKFLINLVEKYNDEILRINALHSATENRLEQIEDKINNAPRSPIPFAQLQRTAQTAKPKQDNKKYCNYGNCLDELKKIGKSGLKSSTLSATAFI